MKMSQEMKTAISYKKEYDMLSKYARLATVPIEKRYYQEMANRTAQYIDWELLQPRKKEETYNDFQ